MKCTFSCTSTQGWRDSFIIISPHIRTLLNPIRAFQAEQIQLKNIDLHVQRPK
jgi:hypothetical protein